MIATPARPGPAHAGPGHHGGHAHHAPPAAGAAATLVVRTDPATPVAGQPAALRLLIRGEGGAPLRDFADVHGEKAHLMVVRDGLDQFAHLHPQVDGSGRLTALYTFPSGGTYRLYADYRAAGAPPATATAEVQVAGDAPDVPDLAPDVPGRVLGGGLGARVDARDARVGEAAAIRFELTDPATGRPVTDLEPYMGERGHLVVLSADGRHYVHAHPAEDGPGAGNVVAFEARFGRPGLYKGWGQFRWRGSVRVVPFVLRVS